MYTVENGASQLALYTFTIQERNNRNYTVLYFACTYIVNVRKGQVTFDQNSLTCFYKVSKAKGRRNLKNYPSLPIDELALRSSTKHRQRILD